MLYLRSRLKLCCSIFACRACPAFLAPNGSNNSWARNRVALHQLSGAGAGVTVWATNGWTYDGLNRVATETTKDGATTSFGYDSLDDVTSRAMPNGLTWSATYLNDGRISTEKTSGSGGLIERTNSYQYYSTGNQWAGLLQTVTDRRGVGRTTTYDDWLRPAVITTAGSLPEQNTTTTNFFDRRGLLTRVMQSFTNYATGPGTDVGRGFDGYGHKRSESIAIGPPDHAALQMWGNQDWDNAGRRSVLAMGTYRSAIAFSYRADGLMTQVNDAVFAYGDNSLLTNRVNSSQGSCGSTTHEHFE